MFEKSARKAATRVYIRDMWTLLLVKRTEQNNLLRMLLRMSVNNIEWLWGRERTSTKQKTKRKQYIHQRFQASFLSSVRNKSWMRIG